MNANTPVELRGWSIDRKSGHCGHSSGLQAYWDSTPTSSGALRCVGPFASPGTSLTEPNVKRFIHDLTAAIESLPEYSGRYALWGAFQSQARFEEHVVTVLGEPAGFLPNPALRTELTLMANATLSLEREWHVDPAAGCATHRCGLCFCPSMRNQGRVNVSLLRSWPMHVTAVRGGTDAATMHPELIDDMISMLAEYAFEMIQGRRRPLLQRIDVDIDAALFQWHDNRWARAS
jgi:hypothetical protein